MSAKGKVIQIINESTIMPNSSFTLHIDYNESLTLKELVEVLDLINKAINDINRDRGIKNNAKLGKEYAAEVTGVESGSIVVHILTYFVAPIALSVLANFIYDRLKGISSKKEKKSNKEELESPISISVNGNNNLIELNITKPNKN